MCVGEKGERVCVGVCVCYVQAIEGCFMLSPLTTQFSLRVFVALN